MSRPFHAIPALEPRQLLSGSVNLSVYGDMGVHTAAVPLPSGSQGFVGFTANPLSGTASFDLSNSVQYTYNASGSTSNDSFTFSYIDGGVAQTSLWMSGLQSNKRLEGSGAILKISA